MAAEKEDEQVIRFGTFAEFDDLRDDRFDGRFALGEEFHLDALEQAAVLVLAEDLGDLFDIGPRAGEVWDSPSRFGLAVVVDADT